MLSVHELTRVYGEHTVLDRVSFDVEPGRMTGFVGANGAGKTTAMRIIVGVLGATGGAVRWDGADIDLARRRSMGYMPEERGLYPKMSALDQLVFFGRLHGMTRSDAATRARMLLGRLGLEDRVDDPLEKLSLGNQQRVQIAAALIHEPTALVLDEPFSGLDPLAVDSLLGLLRDEVSPLVPVLLSSHQLDLVERLCDDLVILAGGRVVAAGRVEDLRRRQETRFRLRLVDERDPGWLRDLQGVEVLRTDGTEALLSLGGRVPEDVLTEVLTRSRVAEFAQVVRPLSEVYREVVA